MKKNEYIRFLRWFRTEICEETPLSHEYFVDKYISNELKEINHKINDRNKK